MAQRTVFITGASSGLGQGLALHYAKQGDKVFAAARRIDRLREMAKSMPGEGGKPMSAKDLDWQWVKRIFDVNTTAAAVTLAAAAPAMIQAGRGQLVGVDAQRGRPAAPPLRPRRHPRRQTREVRGLRSAKGEDERRKTEDQTFG